MAKGDRRIKEALFIVHEGARDVGSLAGALSRRGYRLRTCLARREDVAALDALAPDLVVVLGGLLGANDEAEHPFIRDELALLGRRLKADQPTLGICLGGQLVAKALGARVHTGGAPELTWGPISLTEAGRGSALAHLGPEETAVVHWHNDSFELPAGAIHLASTEDCPNQAFSWGGRSLAVQFHPEITASLMARWLAHARADSEARRAAIARMRADTARWSQTLERQTARCLNAWLDQVED